MRRWKTLAWSEPARHRLRAIIILAICGVLCGAERWVEIEEFGKAKEAFFTELLGLPNGIPSHNTFGRVFALLDPKQFEASFVQWVQGISQTVKGVIAIDGKTLRRSHDQSAGKKALHLGSSWAVENRLVLAQLAGGARNPMRLRRSRCCSLQLALGGCIVTIDAMGTQTKIAEQIIEQEGDYALALKDNHGNLYDEVKATFALAEKDGFPSQYWEADRQVEKAHSRLEIREHWTLSDAEILAYLDPEQKWKGLRGIGVVRGSATYGAEDDERNALLPAQFFLSQNLRHCGQEPLGHRKQPALGPRSRVSRR